MYKSRAWIRELQNKLNPALKHDLKYFGDFAQRKLLSLLFINKYLADKKN